MIRAPFADTMTLISAQMLLRTLVDEGHHCPLCTQFAKIYNRTITRTMARALLLMYQTGGVDWQHVPTTLSQIRVSDESKLRYWLLIEENTKLRDDGGPAGWWRVTEKGRAFLRGEITVEKYARVYDTRLLELVGPRIDIHDALGKRFDLRELMETTGDDARYDLAN